MQGLVVDGATQTRQRAVAYFPVPSDAQGVGGAPLVPAVLLNLVTALDTRLQAANGGSGRQLGVGDSDLVEPMLELLVACAPRWFAQQKAEWPFKCGRIVGVSRVDVVVAPSFSVRLHHFSRGYADVTPHNHEWNFFSRVLRGGYSHTLYRIRPQGEEPGGFGDPATRAQRYARWSRAAHGAYGEQPAETAVRLKVQMQHTHSEGGVYFIDSAAVHGIERVDSDVVTMLVRSKLGNLGSASTYNLSGESPAWHDDKQTFKKGTGEMDSEIATWAARCDPLRVSQPSPSPTVPAAAGEDPSPSESTDRVLREYRYLDSSVLLLGLALGAGAVLGLQRVLGRR